MSTDIHIGDTVWIPLASGKVFGTIVEDRGPLGKDGQHLYRVVVPNDPFVSDEFTVQAQEIERMGDAERASLLRPLHADAVTEYLSSGGLVSILLRNSPERVWLRRSPDGSLTYTFIEGFSVTGGRPAPQSALYGERIFKPKLEEVLDFLRSFGLSKSQAQQVVNQVGTGP